jgi:hypothetical protein
MSSGKPQTGKEVVLMTTRSEVRFTADGDVELGAWLYLPKGKASRNPVITMAHAYADEVIEYWSDNRPRLL